MTNFSEKTQFILESFQRDRGETPAVSEEYNEVKAILKDVVRYKIMNEQSMPTAEQRRRGILPSSDFEGILAADLMDMTDDQIKQIEQQRPDLLPGRNKKKTGPDFAQMQRDIEDYEKRYGKGHFEKYGNVNLPTGFLDQLNRFFTGDPYDGPSHFNAWKAERDYIRNPQMYDPRTFDPGPLGGRAQRGMRSGAGGSLTHQTGEGVGGLEGAVETAELFAGAGAAAQLARQGLRGAGRLARRADDALGRPRIDVDPNRLGSGGGNIRIRRTADVPDTAGSGGAPRPPKPDDFDNYADYVEAMNRFESARSTPSAPSPKPVDTPETTAPKPVDAPETTAPKPVDAPETTAPKPTETPETRVLSPGELRREIRRVSQDPEIRAQVQQETIEKAAAERAAAMDKFLGPTRVRTKEAIDTAVDNTLIAKQLWDATKGAYRYSRKHPIKSSAMLAAIGELGGSFPGMPGQPAYSSAYESLANLYRGNFPEAGEKAAEGAIRASWYLFPTLSGKLLQAGRLASELALGQKVKDAVAERLRQASERVPEGPGLGPALRDVDIRAAEAINTVTGAPVNGNDGRPRITPEQAAEALQRIRGGGR